MQRSITQHLVNWRNDAEHSPILLRGARQVGKTYIIEDFAAKYFSYFVNINFELEPDYIDCFNKLNPQEIINNLMLKQNVPIISGKTLLFLDEIQVCPQAILSLRYFKEKMPQLHVIGAGSLLEFILNDENFRMPVGRVQYLYMKPLSFEEFLLALNKNNLLAHIKEATFKKPPAAIAHRELLKLVRDYFILGGMPAVVASYVKYANYQTCQIIQSNLLSTYRNDFGKYSKLAQHKYLISVFNKTPGLIGKKIKYSHLDPESLSRNIKGAIILLQHAGLLTRVNSAGCSSLPLNAFVDEKIFKLLFVDIGMVQRAGKINISDLMTQDLVLANQGALAEQFVGQELIAYQNPHEESELYFWTREKKGSQAEVDYVINLNGKIVPIEVKSGKVGKLKSLQQFMLEKNTKLGIKISQQELGIFNKILSLPLYMISELERFAVIS